MPKTDETNPGPAGTQMPVEEPNPFADRAAKLKEQIRLDNLGKGGKEKFDVVVPPAEDPKPATVPVPVQLAPWLIENSCARCPGWHRTNPRLPVGQCLPLSRSLPGPLHTTDYMGCSLSIEEKQGLKRR